ncbi:MAG TPA: type II toxin-antitoxin system HicB family antitoxin [Stellaceae bacterium]
MTTMTHDGYVANVELDEAAGFFHGEVINTRDVLTFQGRTLDELKAAFADTIADYADWCRDRGKQPEKALLRTLHGSGVARAAPADRRRRGARRQERQCLRRIDPRTRSLRPAQYDFGSPSTRSAMCDRISCGVMGAMRAIWISRK